MKLNDVLRKARSAFEAAGLETPALDARILVRHATGLSQTNLITQGNKEIPGEQCITIEGFIKRRVEGEPVCKITGHRDFWGLDFLVTRQTLSPRPETETLVAAARDWACGRQVENGNRLRILDLGTGTGCVMMSLLHELKEAEGVAVDFSPAALDVAKKNAKILGVAERCDFRVSDWFENVDGVFDLIVSNPPYIPNPDIPTLAKEVRNYDPILALDGGKEGMEEYKKIFMKTKTALKKEGRAFFEIGFGQSENIRRLVDDSHLFMVGITPDIAGVPRVVEISHGEK